MKQQYRLNESELRSLIAECIKEVVNEEMDERNIFTNVRDTLGAVKDTFQKGGNFQAHKNYRNMQTSKNDIAKLNQKYGVQNDAMNTNQLTKQFGAEDVEKLEAEKQQAIANITAKYDKKIAAAKENARQRAQEYRNKRNDFGAQKKASNAQMNKAMNSNPYAGYNQANPAEE